MRIQDALTLAVIAGFASSCSRSEPVLLTFVGDVLLASAPGEMIRSGGDPFAAVSPVLAKADVTIANLECPVAKSGAPVAKVYAFRADPSTLTVLQRHVHAVSLANNHSGDYSPAALRETMQNVRSAGLRFFGAGENLRAAHEPLLLEKRELKIGLLGYDEYRPREFEAGASAPGVAWSEDEQVVADIAHAHALHADIVVPFMHWGWEGEGEPSPRQRSLAHKMIDAGAEAVIGAHPHRTQGVEYYRGKLIVYSLGNFVFDLTETDDERLGWLLRAEVDDRGIRRWATLLVRIDGSGVPTPDAQAMTPCGTRIRPTVARCRGGALPEL